MFKLKRIISLALLLVLLVSAFAVPASAASYSATIYGFLCDDRDTNFDYRYATNYGYGATTTAVKTVNVPRSMKYISFCYEQGAPASQTFVYIDGVQNKGLGGYSIMGTGKLTSMYVYRVSALDTSSTTTFKLRIVYPGNYEAIDEVTIVWQ